MKELDVFEQFEERSNNDMYSIFSIKCEDIDITPLITKTIQQEVVDYNSAVQALNMALQSRKMLKMLDEIRKSFSDPHLKIQKDLINIAKPYESDLKSIEKELTEKINNWIILNNIDLEELNCSDGCFKVNTTWDYEIINKESVPVQFHKVDEESIERAIKSGLRKIPGVRIFEKKEVKLRIKN